MSNIKISLRFHGRQEYHGIRTGVRTYGLPQNIFNKYSTIVYFEYPIDENDLESSIIDIGVVHDSVTYNCKLFLLVDKDIKNSCEKYSGYLCLSDDTKAVKECTQGYQREFKDLETRINTQCEGLH